MFYKVKEKEEVILERFGKFVAVKQEPGLRFNMPGTFRKVAARVPMEVTQHQVNLETKTSDNIFAAVPTILHLQVADAKKFHYNADNPYRQASDKIVAVMKQLTSQMEFDHLYQAREALGSDVREKVGKEIEDLYGLRIVDVIVDQPVAPNSVQEAYNGAKSSEQKAKARLNAAQADKQASILEAEGRKEQLRLDGEGVAAQRAAMFQNLTSQFNTLVEAGMPKETAEKILIEMMRLDTLRDVAKGGNVIVTSTNDNNPITDTQAALRAASKIQQPPTPRQ